VRTNGSVKVWIAIGAACVLAGVGALAATASTPRRSTVLSQLERPARPAAAASRTGHPFRATLRSHGYVVALTLSDNRASARHPVRVRVTRRGSPVRGARVGVSYSMPSMGMWRAYVSQLASSRQAGTYAATEATLGMAGLWQLRVSVKPHSGPQFSAAVTDRMPV
jgi:hypothetical protein